MKPFCSSPQLDSWTTVKTGCGVECKSCNLDDVQRRIQHLDRQRQESRKIPRAKKMLNETFCSFCFSMLHFWGLFNLGKTVSPRLANSRESSPLIPLTSKPIQPIWNLYSQPSTFSISHTPSQYSSPCIQHSDTSLLSRVRSDYSNNLILSLLGVPTLLSLPLTMKSPVKEQDHFPPTFYLQTDPGPFPPDPGGAVPPMLGNPWV